ncbi:MAG: IS3 family transposase [Pseudonocardiaceae bacterium]
MTCAARSAFEDSDETYGHRRVHAQLARWDTRCSPEPVRGIMREQGLVACQPRPWRHNLTESDPSAGPIPDLVCRDFTATATGRKMVGDITYYVQLRITRIFRRRRAGSISRLSSIVIPRRSSDGRWTTTTPRNSSPTPSSNSTCATRSAAPESATIMPRPSFSSLP